MACKQHRKPRRQARTAVTDTALPSRGPVVRAGQCEVLPNHRAAGESVAGKKGRGPLRFLGCHVGCKDTQPTRHPRPCAKRAASTSPAPPPPTRVAPALWGLNRRVRIELRTRLDTLTWRHVRNRAPGVVAGCVPPIKPCSQKACASAQGF